MAVVVSMARGHDASYPFKTTGTGEGPVTTGQYGASCYLSAVEKGGEPAGTRRFSFEWAYRPASMRRVIAGFPEKAGAGEHGPVRQRDDAPRKGARGARLHRAATRLGTRLTCGRA